MTDNQGPNERERFLLKVAMVVFALYMAVQTYCLIYQTLHRR